MNALTAILAQNQIRTFYEWAPMVPLTQWWHLLLAILVGLLLTGYIVLMYRADSVELPSGLTFLLSALRILAFAALLVFILSPEKRSETRIVKTSRISLLVDTSLSMGLRDPLPGGGQVTQRRIDEVINVLENSDVVDELRNEHDVSVYRFDEKPQPEQIGVLPKNKADEVPIDRSQQLRDQALKYLSQSTQYAGIGFALFGSSLFFGVVYFFVRLTRKPTLASWLLALSLLLLYGGVGMIGLAHANAGEFDLPTALGIQAPVEPNIVDVPVTVDEATDGQDTETTDTLVDWKKSLNPTGTSTRLGQAVEFVINKERGGPMAGIILLTDGRDNMGSGGPRAVAIASESGVPVYCVGIGSDQQPRNVRVDDIQAPPRVLPNDKFKIKGLIQSVGMAGRTTTVKLVSVDEEGREAEQAEGEATIQLPADGGLVPVEFEIARAEEGIRRFTIRVDGSQDDLDPRDNSKSSLVEVVDRKTKVLIVAGGPMREFRFLRNQLFRDDEIKLSVWLQSAKAGADQEADEILDDFPSTREEMFEYDCVIGFDPDWRELTSQQAILLEKWLAEQAGGLILIAGPVQTPEWTRRPRGDEAIDLIRRIYPVSFYSQASPTLKLGKFGGEVSFPIQFTREGRAANFLWLGESTLDSQENWDRFEGIFGYYAVHEQKAGADVLARFGDPDTMINDEFPIYMASHFYGSGRVFFQASGEMWRMRSIDVSFFEDYYTQIIRWASQGRLLRDSQRGVLLADKQQCWVGDQVVIQAILRDAQDQPLVAETVSAVLLKPDGSTESMSLIAAKDSVRAGTFVSQFSALVDGDYRVSLAIPDSAEGDILTTTIEAKIPDLEKARPQRNDALLKELSEKSGGKFYIGANALLQPKSDPESLLTLAAPQDQITFLPGTPSREFSRRVMAWLLTMVVLALSIEWIVRRLNKLA